MLKFKDPQTRLLADQLMQPALIRIIDNIRKHLDDSDWKGSYHETQLWPDSVAASEMQRFKELQAQLSNATPEEADDIRTELTRLPQPFPGYELHLTHKDQERIVDVWQLCYCVCFEQYPVSKGSVSIDTSLIDQEINDVDWLVLDNKAKSIIEEVFKQLGTDESC
ncbi:hypothetical protein PN498_09470 [Oscillatoria sp. CS-180]|uniref:hypothetical protein n=1 Tax=Oscillatoria sp. CS-180 TaxID=3021720 RepID=UPI00232C83FF|nr:hypothetical protein [Oscillatoria sp. CS-180]MDB9526214.1 hypothetical protein [Oscillatoria sp. CS-180]